MSDPVACPNATLKGCRVLLAASLLVFPLGCGPADDPAELIEVVLQPSELCSDHNPSAVASFDDSNLEEAIFDAVADRTVSDLTCGLLAGLTELEASSQPDEIESLVGIQNLTSLTVLNLFNNSIADISALSGLTSLTDLRLGGNLITDVSPLSGLRSLTVLSLFNNSIANISALSELTSLTFLGLSNNSIANINALSGLTSLTVLALFNNSIADINVLSGLTSLTALTLLNNSVTDISSLSGLTSLTFLGLGENSITDISALSGLTSLTELALFSNPGLANIQPLLDNAGLGAGDEVDLESTSVSCVDVAALEAKGVMVFSDCVRTSFRQRGHLRNS